MSKNILAGRAGKRGGENDLANRAGERGGKNSSTRAGKPESKNNRANHTVKSHSESYNFRKLFCYYGREIAKIMLIYYILMLVAALLARSVSGLEGNFAAQFIKGFANGFCFAMVASVIINGVTRVWQKFNQNFYGPESYLMHALPVRTRTILGVWLSLGVVTTLVNVVASLGAIMLAFAGSEVFNSLWTALGEVAAVLEISTVGLVMSLVGVMVLEILTIFATGILADIIGHRANDHQIGRAVLFGFVLYAVVQTVILGAVYLLAAANNEIAVIFNNNNLAFNSLTTVLWLVSGLYLAVVVSFGLIGRKLVKRGVDVR